MLFIVPSFCMHYSIKVSKHCQSLLHKAKISIVLMEIIGRFFTSYDIEKKLVAELKGRNPQPANIGHSHIVSENFYLHPSAPQIYERSTTQVDRSPMVSSNQMLYSIEPYFSKY